MTRNAQNSATISTTGWLIPAGLPLVDISTQTNGPNTIQIRLQVGAGTEHAVLFTPGIYVMTTSGYVLVDDLQVGDELHMNLPSLTYSTVTITDRIEYWKVSQVYAPQRWPLPTLLNPATSDFVLFTPTQQNPYPPDVAGFESLPYCLCLIPGSGVPCVGSDIPVDKTSQVTFTDTP